MTVFEPMTSTIEFCEENYQLSKNIAEFVNTFSSLAMCAHGLAGLSHEKLEMRFKLAYFSLFVVGAGSVAFHATLSRLGQIMDEVPMVYCGLILAYCILQRNSKKVNSLLVLFLLAAASLFTFPVTLFKGNMQFYVFQGIIISMEIFCLVAVYQLASHDPDPNVQVAFKRGLSQWFLGVACWLVDRFLCDYLTFFHIQPLHAIWHLLASSGVYHLLTYLVYKRQIVLGYKPTLDISNALFPFVNLKKAE